MSDFKFLHAADLHIDSPMLGLERYPDAPAADLRGSTRRAFEHLVATALEERVAFVVLVGDLFDDDWRDYNTGVFFASQLTKLARVHVPVFIVRGNHDAANEVTRQIRWPENTTVFEHAAATTKLLPELGVAVHGQSFSERNLKANLARAYPAPVGGHFNLGLLHTALEGREGHASYAPCSAADLASKGYDYWALGHIHKREVVSESPHIVFPGNLQGRSVRETGAKGASLVTVRSNKVAEVRHVPLDVVRWALVDVDATHLAQPDDVIDRAFEKVGEASADADGRVLAVRVRFFGVTPAAAMRATPARWRSELLARLSSLRGRVWLEKAIFDMEPLVERSGGSMEGLAVLARLLAEMAQVEAEAPAFVGDVAKKVASELDRAGADSPFTAANLARLRAEALDLLRERLGGAKGGVS